MNPLLLLKYWRYIAGAAILGVLWWQLHVYGVRRYDAGIAHARAEQAAKDEKATTAHNATIAKLNEAHHASELELQARLATALARPATRTIRVPVSTACPAPESPGNASVPEAGDPPAGFVDVVDAGYPVFRDWLIRFAGGPVAGSGTAETVPDRR